MRGSWMGPSRILVSWLLLATLVTNSQYLAAAAAAADAAAADKKRPTKSKATKKKADDSKLAEKPVDASDHYQKELLGNIGMSPNPLIGFGGTIGLVKQSGDGYEGDVLLSSGKSGNVAASVTHIGARYRKGMFKFAYLGVGPGIRMASGKWYVLNKTQTAEYEGGSSFTALTLDAGLGVQFKFGAFALGADLVGISYPLFKMGVSTTVPTQSDTDNNDADTQLGAFNSLAGGLTLTIAKVGVGFMF